MTSASTVRDSARRRNTQRVSDLTEKLDELKSREVANSAELVEAFRPLVEMMADLLRETDSSRSQVADMLDRLEQSLNRLEGRMGALPEQMQQGARAAGEGMAQKAEVLIDAVERMARTGAGHMKTQVDEARKATLRQAETDKTRDARMGAALKRMEGAAAANAKAAQAVQAAQKRMGWMLGAAAGVTLLAMAGAATLSSGWLHAQPQAPTQESAAQPTQ